MTTENTDIAETEDDLDTFSADFFGQKKEEKSEVQPTDEGEEEPESETDNEDAGEDTDPEPTQEEPEDEEEEDEPPLPLVPKGRKSAKERITELIAARYEAEKRAEELEKRIADLEKQRAEPEVKTPQIKAPDPDDTLEDGSLKYPLGEFDPKFISDLTKFTIRLETEAVRAADEERRQKEAAKAAEDAAAAAQAEIEEKWAEKVAASTERLPELREKAPILEETFRNLDPAYGQYLASTIMTMDYGPDVLDYLASNIEEAKRIVASGPTSATIALGRLEARFVMENENKNHLRRKTVAPAPAPITRGTVAKPSVKPDTENLDEFEDLFYQRRR